jgi:predicted DCC family thiol-disulfide oxidoreductase YuxK
MLAEQQIALIYDAACGFCSSSVRWLERFDWRHRLSAIPNQTIGLAAALGMPRARVEMSAWVVLPDGRRLRGHQAMAAAVDALLPFGLPLFRVASGLPLLRRLGALTYRWVSANRRRFKFGRPDLRRGAPSLPLPQKTLGELERRGTLLIAGPERRR